MDAPVATAQGTRATTPGGPQQMGGFAGTAGLAPWLRQGTGELAPMQQAPQLGAGQQGILAQQQALAQQLRNAPMPAKAAAGRGVTPEASFGTQLGAADYSDAYDAQHGAGTLSGEAARYADLDRANQLGDYESLYGEFPETDTAAMEKWFEAARIGGDEKARQQAADEDVGFWGGFGLLDKAVDPLGISDGGLAQLADPINYSGLGASGEGYYTPGTSSPAAAGATGGGTVDAYGQPITAQTPSGALTTPEQWQAWMQATQGGGDYGSATQSSWY